MRKKDPQLHQELIEKLQKQLQEQHGHAYLQHNTHANSLRNGAYKKGGRALNLSQADGYLAFNPEEGWIEVEPRTTFDRLCRFTLRYNLLPPVVPEFPKITVGGAVMGTALESSSHRFGQVSDQVLEYELLLGDGSLVRASKSQNPELFYGISGSYGTLALLTAVKLRLIPAKPFMQLRYENFTSLESALKQLNEAHQEDFVEGIVYSPHDIVVIYGTMVDAPKAPLFRQRFFWSEWYAQHVEKSAKERSEETMPLFDYLFRLNRGAFWMGRYILSLPKILRLLLRLKVPHLESNPPQPTLLFRLFFDWLFPSERLYKQWHRVPTHLSEKIFLIHDFYMPARTVERALPALMERCPLFPIWLCPIRGTQTPQLLSPHYGEERYLNVGLYGIPSSPTPLPELTAEIEQLAAHYGGRKMLYSLTYYDEESFKQLYNIERYEALRRQFHASSTFPSLYHKIKA